jgi:hypothetical protein
MQRGRTDYNMVIQRTETEEMLLNLVRVRYGDRPLFLTVSSVSTSFSWTQGAGAEGFAFESRSSIGDNVGVSGNLEYTEMKSSGSKMTWVVPSRYGVLSW